MKKTMEWEDIKGICLKHKIDYENVRKEIFWIDYEDLYNTKNRSKFSDSYVKVKSLINLRKNISRRNQFNFDFSYHVIEKQILNLFKK
tara:strand:- start:2205 stop:2468 length:264 start_codon:yes stop_codon:yes gene_type:complete